MKIISIKILLIALITISVLSTIALAGSNVSTITIYTEPSWKSFDTKVNGWTSINFDDSYWLDVKVNAEYSGYFGEASIFYPETPSSPPYYFRKIFELSGTEIMSGSLYFTTFGGTPSIYINDNYIGTYVGHGSDIDIAPHLKIGKNVIAVEIQKSGVGGYLLALTSKIRVVSAPASSPSPTSLPSMVSEDSAGAPSSQLSKSASVNLHGEKTDVVLGEDILLKLSAVNLITKPKMHVQVIIIPPSGMSVTSSEFVQSGAGQYTTTYELEPGKGRDIEVRIRSNQVGDFNVNGRIIYYFGDEKNMSEDYNLNLPIKVRKEIALPAQNPTAIPAQKSTPGFGAIISIIVLLLNALLRKRR